MSGDEQPSVHEELSGAVRGDAAAAQRLATTLYGQLRAAAQRRMEGERPGHTLSATALVHEAYLKIAGPREVSWQNRAHFYAAAAEAMRQVLLDHAKGRGRQKRGGKGAGGRVTLDEAATLAHGEGTGNEPTDGRTDFVALDEALRRLEGRDPRAGQVVRLKYFAGLEMAEVAEVLGVSVRTAKNDWAFARAWLERELARSAESEEGSQGP